MVSSTGGDGGASSGGVSNQHLTGQPPPPPSNSTLRAAGPTPSRLLALFEECGQHGVWASLETYRSRGEVFYDFLCRVRANTRTVASSNRQRTEAERARNVERTRQWKENRRHPPPQPSKEAAPPASAVNVTASNTSTPTTAKSFAEVAAEPSGGRRETITAETVKVVDPTTAGKKGRKTTLAHPTKVAKTTLAASRMSQRAALLSKRRAAAAVAETPAPSPSSGAEDSRAPPEVLRGTDGVTRLNSSLEISLTASPPPLLLTPPSPSSTTAPPTPPPWSPHNACDCLTPCTEKDFHDEKWADGVRLNTLDPHWEKVFPHFRGLKRCRFCKEPLPELEDSGGDSYGDNGDSNNGDDNNGSGGCSDCKSLTVFALVQKFAPRWRYPNS